jgi:hypothetical protein
LCLLDITLIQARKVDVDAPLSPLLMATGVKHFVDEGAVVKLHA